MIKLAHGNGRVAKFKLAFGILEGPIGDAWVVLELSPPAFSVKLGIAVFHMSVGPTVAAQPFEM